MKITRITFENIDPVSRDFLTSYLSQSEMIKIVFAENEPTGLTAKLVPYFREYCVVTNMRVMAFYRNGDNVNTRHNVEFRHSTGIGTSHSGVWLNSVRGQAGIHVSDKQLQQELVAELTKLREAVLSSNSQESTDTVSVLRQLKQLLDENLISKQEYEAKRVEVLKRM